MAILITHTYLGHFRAAPKLRFKARLMLSHCYKNDSYCHANNLHFHNKGYAPKAMF